MPLKGNTYKMYTKIPAKPSTTIFMTGKTIPRVHDPPRIDMQEIYKEGLSPFHALPSAAISLRATNTIS